MNVIRLIPLVAILAAPLAAAPVFLDRVAVTIGTHVITETEIDREICLTAFLERKPVDLSPASRKAAAERLIDQYLVRNDMEVSEWPQPEASESAKLIANFKQKQFHNDEAAYKEALQRYGISEQELQKDLLWQLTALRYTEFRFQSENPPMNANLQEQLEQKTEQRSQQNAAQSHPPPPPEQRLGHTPPPRTDPSGAAPGPPPKPNPQNPLPQSIDQQLDNWLKEARSRARIVYHNEAFQ